MSLEKQDWQKLKAPLLILAAVTLAVISLFGAAYYFNQNQELALQNQQNLLNAARQRYQLSGAEKDMIVDYLPKYQMLISKGFVGEEQRIEWVEHLRQQHKMQKLFGIKYSISPQEKYTPAFAANLGGFTMNRSVMKLELDMLHEGDLLRLTEALNAENSAPFILRDCEINRLNPGSQLSNQLTANMHALCELDWLTLREPAAAQLSSVP
jgi:hypothetical protein